MGTSGTALHNHGMELVAFVPFVRPSTLAVIVVVTVAWVYLYARSAAKYRNDVEFGQRSGCKPPASLLSYKWPLAIDIVREGFKAGREKQLLAFFTKHFNLLHTTAEARVLGGVGYVTQDPRNVEAILSTKFQDFYLGPRSDAMEAMIGHGIFTQDGPDWKRSREVLRRQFVQMQYQNLKGFQVHLDNMIERLGSASGVVDLQPIFYRLTLGTTIAMILGQPVDSFNHEVGDTFSKAFDKASMITATRVRLGDLYFLYRPRGFTEACNTIKQYTYQLVTNALQREAKSEKASERSSFIEELHHEMPNLELVRDQVLNILIAGRDTTAATLSYVFYLLLQNPSAYKMLRDEVNRVVGHETEITRAHIQSMPYLHNVLKETLRLYPPVPINTRFCKNTTTLPSGGGSDGNSPLLIREKMPVAYSVYHMQRSEQLYGSDSLLFRPDRWDGPELANIGWGYLPFNSGPRVCLGKDFALMLSSCAIIRVIQAFPSLKLAPGQEVSELGAERQHLGLTLSNAEGCKVLLE